LAKTFLPPALQHWIYDLDVLDKLLAAVDVSEFHDPPSGPFYRRDLGLQSGYGDLVRGVV
jgi:hypothetical protein